MVYDWIWVLSLVENEKIRGIWVIIGSLEGTAQMIKERGLWSNRDKRIVGPIPGVEIGDVFFFRMELCVIGLHGQPQAGIDYLSAYQSLNGEPITMSVIVSGGYEDDEDTGREIIYSGHGVQDKNNWQCMKL
ncbi:hypothetical protein ACH5RR_031630 [Cinchona calisaya]|uniref:YDG domain-containing protein n=1 Tax=Cinchona calisaya TaxID=153742 RepID=A0ABD2YFS9_9GENT